MDASIVICVKNGGDLLEKQLNAVANQSTSYSYEIVVVNNGSRDNTDQLLKDWVYNSHVSVPVKIFSQPDLKGIPAVRNFAVQQAAGEVIAFCDADDEVSEGWLQSFVGQIKGRKVLAGGRIEAYDSKGNYLPSLFPRGLIGTSYLPHVGNCNCAIDRKLFFEIGGYDESLPRYGFEDVDFSWRIQEAGYPIEYVDEALIRFRVSDSKTSLKKKFLLGKGRVLMARRYPRYDSASYSLGYCIKKNAVITLSIFRRLARERTLNRRELSMLVAAVGNLYGSLYYSGNNKKPTPKLINS
ncbi:glycosyltransferase family 2 protein [Rothia nasimurium]|uniref:glycosyltransferase family 2 protein n=1 Tax=Rothia nasimurium TaxID=85336 RepID=UPI001F1EE97D|nr:glycosyltransferase [Rothia nasimurium]